MISPAQNSGVHDVCTLIFNKLGLKLTGKTAVCGFPFSFLFFTLKKNMFLFTGPVNVMLHLIIIIMIIIIDNFYIALFSNC